MKRRNFLLLSTAGTAAVAFPVWHYFLRDIEYPAGLAQPALLPEIWEPETLQAVGLAYQEQVPTENSENKLAKLLLKELDPQSNTLTDDLIQRVRQDFETGKTVMVKGWVLSQTEARQCALATFQPPH